MEKRHDGGVDNLKFVRREFDARRFFSFPLLSASHCFLSARVGWNGTSFLRTQDCETRVCGYHYGQRLI